MMIFEKMSLILSEMKSIEKSQTNKVQGFKFRGIDQIYTALNPLLAKHGVFFTPKIIRMIERDTVTAKGSQMHGVYLEIEYTFYASDGSNVSCVSAGEALDSGDKATSKAMSIALKYALFQTFCIPTEEEKENDPDNYAYNVQKNQPQSNAKPTQQPAPKQQSLQERKNRLFDTLNKECGSPLETLAYISKALNRSISSGDEVTVQDMTIINQYYSNNKPVKQSSTLDDLPFAE